MSKLYKYQGVEDHHFNSLRNQKIWAARYSSLNDPNEFALHKKIQIRTLKGIQEMLDPNPTDEERGKYFAIPEDELKKLAQERATGYKDRLIDIQSMLNTIQDKANNFGIYSLSSDPLNELMWAHYTNNHVGFVIEFDEEQLIQECGKLKGIYAPVIYSPTIPELNYGDLNDNLKRMYATKSEVWEYEKEVRFVFQESGLKFISSHFITGIYFGERMSNDHKKRIINALQGFPHIKYYQVSTQDNSYEFIKNELTYSEIEAIKLSSNK